MEFIPIDPLLNFHPDTLEVIRKKYNLENDRMTQSIDLLEEWVKKQPHFIKQFKRRYYEMTLIACKGSVEKAKSRIDKLCTLKTLLPNFFICNIKEIISSLNDVACSIPLPNMTADYERLIFIKTFGGAFTSDHISDYCKLCIALTEYLKVHEYVDGFVIIQDLRDCNLMEILTKINLVEIQQFLTIMIEGFGARMNAIHVISQSKLIDLLVKTVKPFLPPKIANRINLHQELDTLFEVVDKELLPSDFGGSQKSLKKLQEEWEILLCSEEHQKYLEVMVESRTDESLRKVDKFNEQHMGLPGSFRTLTVD